MLLLLFEIGTAQYALDAAQIVEIVPQVRLKKIPATPHYVAGLMNYRGEGIPVVDLNELVDATPSEDAYSTRIIIIRYPFAHKGDQHLALLANNVIETVKTAMTKAPRAGVVTDKALYTGETAPATGEMIQWFDIRKILPAEEIAALFAGEEYDG